MDSDSRYPTQTNIGHYMSEYANLLRSPAWQKRRLEILGARGFKCEECDSTEKELHVHHHWFDKGKKPWEYDDCAYGVLCDDCHKERHDVNERIKKLLSRYNTRTLKDLADFIEATRPLSRQTSKFYLAYTLIDEIGRVAAHFGGPTKSRYDSLIKELIVESEARNIGNMQGGSDA